jgi:nickel transport protein
MKARVIVVAALLAAMCASAASAHSLQVFAYVEGGKVKVEAYFRSGAKAQNADVRVYDASGNLLLSGKTDAEGVFSFDPPVKADIEIEADAGEGHVSGRFKISAAELGGGDARPSPNGAKPQQTEISPGADNGGADESSNAQIIRLQKEVRELRDEMRLRDIIGGVGYIFGVAGVAMYILSRRQRRRPGENGIP